MPHGRCGFGASQPTDRMHLIAASQRSASCTGPLRACCPSGTKAGYTWCAGVERCEPCHRQSILFRASSVQQRNFRVFSRFSSRLRKHLQPE
jgi:hypothetical protein